MEVDIGILRCSDADRTREINLIETRLNSRLRTIVEHFVSAIDDLDSKSREAVIAEKGREGKRLSVLPEVTEIRRKIASRDVNREHVPLRPLSKAPQRSRCVCSSAPTGIGARNFTRPWRNQSNNKTKEKRRVIETEHFPSIPLTAIVRNKTRMCNLP